MSPIDKIPTLGLGGDDEVAIAREVVRKDVDIRLGKKERRLVNRGVYGVVKYLNKHLHG